MRSGSLALAAADDAAGGHGAEPAEGEPPSTYEDEHDAFAASRWNDYVFVANDPKSLAALDKHVEAPTHEVALPLVVLGEPGIGKSALLANWIQRRRARMHRDDFLFQHFVGSSPSSCQLANLLGRLARALRAHYHLREMAVPETEERLRWSLARFLGAAAKKAWPAHLVVVIDSIDALKSDVVTGAHGGTGGGGAPSLHWLPTELPGNVRLILAASASPAGPSPLPGQQQQTAREQRLQQVLLPEDDSEGEERPLEALQQQQPQPLSTTEGGTNAPCNSSSSWGGRIVTELRRRGYPVLAMEPLTEAARGRIIDEFLRRCAAGPGAIDGGGQQQQQQEACLTLTPQQRARIVEAPATRRPLFLRMLLYALKLGVALSAHHSMTLDHQLDRYLGAAGADQASRSGRQDDTSAKGLISEILDLSQQYVEGSGGGSAQVKGLLPRVLSAVYASRDGLSDEELRGLVELGMRERLAVPLDAVVTVLNDMTMLVKGLRSFSHEAFRRVVYDKYIRSPEALVRQHELLARYFQRLPILSPRKLSCLAHHLEVAGLWHKLRDALVDLDHFPLWWAPPRRKEFVALWASLSNRRAALAAEASSRADEGGAIAHEQLGGGGGHGGRLVTGEFDEATMRTHQAPRPYFDVVDEYVGGVEGWRERRHPGDEELRRAVLDVAAFLLEFALQGHEAVADVPICYVHPPLPPDDLKALGVPYLSVDGDGHATLVQPVLPPAGPEGASGTSLGLLEAGGGGGGASSASSLQQQQQPKPLQAELEGPAVTTYFFNRWMWTQFPLVALANCAATTSAADSDVAALDRFPSSSTSSSSSFSSPLPSSPTRPPALPDAPGSPTRKVPLPVSLVKMATLPLPQLVVRRPMRPREGLAGLAEEGMGAPAGAPGLGDKEQVSGAMERMAAELHGDIQQYRREHDTLVQQRAAYERRVLELGNELTDLERTFDGSTTVQRQLEALQGKQRRQTELCAALRRQNASLKWLLLMCDRHPPERPALVQELEEKITQDGRLLARLRERIWAERFEGQAYTVDHPKLRRVVQEALRLQHELLASRYHLRDNLATAAETNLRMMSRGLLHPPAVAASPPPASPRSPRSPPRTPSSRRRSALTASPDAHLNPGSGPGKQARASLPATTAPGAPPSAADAPHKWTRALAVVYARTGIADLDLFLQKLAHCSVLGEQMEGMSRAAEWRLAELKGRQQALERELYSIDEKTADSASGRGGAERDQEADEGDSGPGMAAAAIAGAMEGTLGLEQAVREAYLRYKHVREKAAAALGAEQRARAGLQHVAEILGVLSADGATGLIESSSVPVSLHEVVHQVEAVLDLLQDELERQQHQKLTGGAGGVGGRGLLLHKAGSRFLQGSNPAPQQAQRPAELERALSAFNDSKARIPHHLFRPPVGGRATGGAADAGVDGAGALVEEGAGGGGVRTRNDVKAVSARILRVGQRNAAAALAPK